MVLNYIKLGVAAAILAGSLTLLYTGYSYVKNIGYQQARVECEEKFAQYNKELDAKLQQIAATSTTLVEDSKKANEAISADLATIMKSVKGKTLTIVKNGECIPNKTFSDTINSVNKRVNEGLKK